MFSTPEAPNVVSAEIRPGTSPAREARPAGDSRRRGHPSDSAWVPSSVPLEDEIMWDLTVLPSTVDGDITVITCYNHLKWGYIRWNLIKPDIRWISWASHRNLDLFRHLVMMSVWSCQEGLPHGVAILSGMMMIMIKNHEKIMKKS